MKVVKFASLAFAGFLLAASPSMAGNAGLLLSPTRVVLENGQRFVTVTVRNTGDATGRYKIEMVDAVMDENGGIKLRADGSNDDSAKGMISLSPSNMTLGPDESQTVRLLVKKKDNVPEGEYRSHLEVKMTENDLNPQTNQPQEGTGIAIRSRITTVIPVIVRIGSTNFNLSITDAKLLTGGGNNKQTPEIQVRMAFSGNRSVLGDIKVTHIAPDGKESQLGFLRGVAIYRGVAQRTQTVALTAPEAANLQAGRVRVDFLSQENEGSHVLSEKEIKL